MVVTAFYVTSFVIKFMLDRHVALAILRGYLKDEVDDDDDFARKLILNFFEDFEENVWYWYSLYFVELFRYQIKLSTTIIKKTHD